MTLQERLDAARDDVADVLKQIADEGDKAFEHPRALDAALDAIMCAIRDAKPDESEEPSPFSPNKTFSITMQDKTRSFWSGKDVVRDRTFHYDPVTNWFLWTPDGKNWQRTHAEQAAILFSLLWKHEVAGRGGKS